LLVNSWAAKFAAIAFVKLDGAANALSSEQPEYGLGIVLLQLALMPLQNHPRGFAYVIHCLAELSQYARVYAAGPDCLLDLGKIGAGFPELEISRPRNSRSEPQA